MLKEILTARTRLSDKALYNIWARKISGGWTETTITGSLPLTFRAQKAEALTDYRIYGTAAGAGVQTENLWNAQSTSLIQRQVTAGGDICWAFVITEPGIYTAKCFEDRKGYIYAKKYTISTDTYEIAEWLSLPATNPSPTTTITRTVDADNILIIYSPVNATKSEAIDRLNSAELCVTKSSTSPASYIPPGYKIPLTVTSGQNTDTYPLYIGDIQLGENEYLDYAENKIYKDVSGTLTPTDPPLPFPAISAYQGENTLSSTETVGDVSLTGKIKEVTP